MSRLKKQNKLEHKLKNRFNDLEIKPSESLWNRIEQDLSNSALENNLRNNLNQASYTPSDKVWQNISNQLPAQNNHKRLGYWLSGLTLLAIGFIAGYFTLKHTNNNQTAIVSATQQQTAVLAEPTVENKTALNKSISKPTTKPNAEPKILQQTEPTDEYVTANEMLVQTNAEKTVTIKKMATNTANGNTNATKSKNSNSTNSSKKTVVKQTNKSKPLNGNSFTPTFKNLADSTTPNTVLAEKPTAVENKTEAKTNNKTGTNDNREIVEIKSVDASKTINDSMAQAAPTVATDAYVKPEEELTKFGLTAFIGMQATGMALSMPANNIHNLNKTFELRKELEHTAATWTGGFLINYHINKKFMISSGVTINNIKQTLSYNLTTPGGSTDTNKIQLPFSYLHPTDSVVNGTTRSLENTYSYTEIPLQITYMVGSNSRIQAEFNAGISYALIGSVNAYMPDASCIGFMQIADRNQFPEFRHVFMAFGGVGATYRINAALFLGAQLFGKSALNSMVGNQNWIQQTPYMTGVNVFIRKRF